ncbi:hypothetical protein YC2023_057016 [Brassica napus]
MDVVFIYVNSPNLKIDNIQNIITRVQRTSRTPNKKRVLTQKHIPKNAHTKKSTSHLEDLGVERESDHSTRFSHRTHGTCSIFFAFINHLRIYLTVPPQTPTLLKSFETSL